MQAEATPQSLPGSQSQAMLERVDARIRILLFGMAADETARIRETLAGAGIPFTLRMEPGIHETVNALHEESFHMVLTESMVPHSDKLALLANPVVQQGHTPSIHLIKKDEDAQTREILHAGAAGAIYASEIWRLPYLVISVREREAMARRKRGQDLLLETMKNLSMARRLGEVVEIVRHAARRLSEADGATFVLREGDFCHYVDEDAIGPLWKGLRFPMRDCISGWSILNRRPAVIEDIYLDSRIPVDAYRPTFVKSLVMVPIRPGAPIGAIGTYWSRKRSTTDEEVELIQAMADSTSLAMENVQAYSEMERRIKERTASLEAINKELESFSYSVSHDLKSPLSAISLTCESLSEKAVPEVVRSGLGTIQAATERMKELIEDFLALSRVSKAEMELRPVNLSAIAKALVEGLRAASLASPTRFDIEDGLTVVGDSGLLRIALENLLSNAWKYSSRNPTPRIQFGRRRQPGGLAGPFYVRDNGVGFPMEEADHLFKPFHRLSTSSDFPGTGIGLATVHRVIEKHGGRLWAESSPGNGAVFYFDLPQKSDEMIATPIAQSGRPYQAKRL